MKQQKMPSQNEPALPLPFFIRVRGENWMELLGKLESAAKEEVVCLTEDDHALVQVRVQSWDDYEALSPLLEEYIVPAPERARQKTMEKAKTTKKKTVKALLRGLPWLCSEDMVCACLSQAGFGNAAVRLHNKSNKKKPPLFVLSVDADGDGVQKTKGSQVFELSKLLGFPVHVETLPAGLDAAPQCFKCQEEGHVAKHCRNREKCVKCAGEHASKTCPLTRDEKPTCARCSGPHVASWRGCPAFQSSKNSGEKRQQNSRPTAEGPAKKRRRRRRAARSAPAPPEQGAAPLPAALPAAAAIGDRGGGGNRPRGGGERQSAPAHREEHTDGTASGGAANTEEDEVGATLREAESRFRMMLHAELEAACLTLRETILQREEQKQSQDAGTNTEPEEGTGGAPSAEQQERWTQTSITKTFSRPVQTDARPEKKKTSERWTNTEANPLATRSVHTQTPTEKAKKSTPLGKERELFEWFFAYNREKMEGARAKGGTTYIREWPASAPEVVPIEGEEDFFDLVIHNLDEHRIRSEAAIEALSCRASDHKRRHNKSHR